MHHTKNHTKNHTKTATVALFLGQLLALGACSTETPPPVSTETMPGEPAPATSPDFDLVLGAVKLPVLQGTAATVQVTVTRKAGFVLPITIDQSGLPPGASLTPVTLGPSDASAVLTVTAAAAAPHSLPTPVTIRGTAGAAVVTKPLTVTVTGLPGALDTSFGGGKVIVPVGASDDYAYAMAAQPDGKILLAGRSAERLGDFAVVRLDRDGALDAGFGPHGDGKVTIDWNGASDIAYAVAVAADGTIVLAGTSTTAGKGNDFAVARLLPTGALDPAFASGGKLLTDFGGDSETAYALVLAPDGKILVGGDSNQGGTATGLDFALARYNADGSLDVTFGPHADGKLTTALDASGGRDSIYGLTLEDMGGDLRILAVGGEGDFAIARYLADGQLDAAFGTGGKLTGLFGSTIGAARGVKVAADGKIVVAGHAQHDFALARLTSGGQLDAGFGAGGKVVTAMNMTNWDEAQGLAIDADGKIVVAGWAYEQGGSSGNFAVARYDVSGQLDPSFGGTGMVLTDIATKSKPDQATAVLLQIDDRVPTVRLLVAGYASASNSDFAVARYWR
jgi:uncharacterized delta-60 repeat protein